MFIRLLQEQKNNCYITYKIIVLRRLDLSSIGCYLPTDSDLATNIIREKFNSANRIYTASVAADVDSVQINVKPYSIDAYYGLTVKWSSTTESKYYTGSTE